jgi:hypothetical protein
MLETFEASRVLGSSGNVWKILSGVGFHEFQLRQKILLCVEKYLASKISPSRRAHVAGGE